MWLGDGNSPRGFVDALVTRLAPGVRFHRKFLTRLGLKPDSGIDGKARDVIRAYRVAQARQCRGLVLVVDRDHKKERDEEVQQGLALAKQRGPALEIAVGVARETTDAWIVGDQEAWRRAFDLDDAPEWPAGKRPEDLWGSMHDPESNHPKHVKVRMLKGLGSADDVMEHIDPDRLAAACPGSFRPFQERLRSVLETMASAARR